MKKKKKYKAVLEGKLSEDTKYYRPGQRFTFQHDNPKHTTRPMQCVRKITNSPDLNPTKNLWQDLKTSLHCPSNLTELDLFSKENMSKNVNVWICKNCGDNLQMVQITESGHLQ